MKNARLHQYINDPQYFYTKEGKNMRRSFAETTFIRNLIRSNAKYTSDGYSLFVCNLDKEDQKILLSYQISSEDYEWAIENETRLNAMIKECEGDMQIAIDEYIDDVWHEDMEDMGMSLCHHNDNNEHYWVRT